MIALTIPLPGGLDDTAMEEVKELFDGYIEASKTGVVRGGVISEGDAAAYALVWEWGNARQTKEGPKTVLGINPDGDSVWLSVQAPFGYIRIHEPEFLQILQNKMSEIDFEASETEEEIIKSMKAASVSAAEQIAELLRQVAPVDSGILRESIQAANPDDADLAVTEEDVELGTTHFSHMIRQMLKRLKH